MNRFFLVLALTLATPALAQPDWETVDLGTTEDLYALYQSSFPPWVVGANGFVASVSSDFDTWSRHDIGTTEGLLSIIGPNSNSRFIAGRNGTYRFTTDGGTTWQSNDVPDTTRDYVAVRPNATWFALGNGGALYADLAGNPISWVERTSGVSETLRTAESTSVLMAFGDNGTILRADNLIGETWTSVTSGTTADLHAVAAHASTDWLVVGEGGLILKSTDNGATWTPRTSGTTATFYAIDSAFGADGRRFLVAGENGTLLETTDFGETWCTHSLPTNATLRAVSIPNRDNWFVAGDGGVMLRSETQGGGTCTPVSSESGPEASYTLSVAWPNPAASRAALALSVGHSQHIRAVLVDGLGRRLQMLYNELVIPGDAVMLKVETEGLAPGVYIVHVQGETFAATRQVTVVR